MPDKFFEATAHRAVRSLRFACPRPRRVLIVQFESSRAHYQQRLRSIVSRYGAAPAELFIALAPSGIAGF